MLILPLLLAHFLLAHLPGLPLAWPLPQSLLQPPSPCLQTPPLSLTPPLPLMPCIFVKDRFKLQERGAGVFTGLLCLQLSNYMTADLVVVFSWFIGMVT